MAKKVKASAKSASKINTKKVLRFAHPFYTDVPLNKRKNIPGVGKRMSDYVSTQLEPIPPPVRTPQIIELAEIIGDAGVDEIMKKNSITFHTVGDTGNEQADWAQIVSTAMCKDYNASNPGGSPAFFLHLGDVNYYDNTAIGYHAQFYEPYKNYPGKIIAIPGNHDGELFKYDGTPTGQKTSLQAFMENFCQSAPAVPPAAGTIYREMISQPGVYWMLDAPFVQIIGLYSNIAEGQGYLAVPPSVQSNNPNQQKVWLTQTLTAIEENRKKGNKKALIIAVHHPPFSNGGHEPSTAMLNDIDTACKKASIMPDVILAAHAHSYQSYTRYISFNGKNLQIPFTVNGCGGRGLQPPIPATGARKGNLSYDKSYNGYGYQIITITNKVLIMKFYTVVQSGVKTLYHTITIDLTNNTVNQS